MLVPLRCSRLLNSGVTARCTVYLLVMPGTILLVYPELFRPSFVLPITHCVACLLLSHPTALANLCCAQ